MSAPTASLARARARLPFEDQGGPGAVRCIGVAVVEIDKVKKIFARVMRVLDAPWLTQRRRTMDRLPEQTQRDNEYYNTRGVCSSLVPAPPEVGRPGAAASGSPIRSP